jgi:hypothetical protein
VINPEITYWRSDTENNGPLFFVPNGLTPFHTNLWRQKFPGFLPIRQLSVNPEICLFWLERPKNLNFHAQPALERGNFITHPSLISLHPSQEINVLM